MTARETPFPKLKRNTPQKDEERETCSATLRPAVPSPPNDAELRYLQRCGAAPRSRQREGLGSRRPGCVPPAAFPPKTRGTLAVGGPATLARPLARSLPPPRAAALSHRGRCLLFAGRPPLHRGAPPPTASRPRSAACRRGTRVGRRPFRGGGGAGAAVPGPPSGPFSSEERRDAGNRQAGSGLP